MTLSYHERFDVIKTNNSVYAPFTLGCASMSMSVDYSVFKKIKGEKEKLILLKAELPKTRGYKFETVFHGSF